jgi:hypothetical protein
MKSLIELLVIGVSGLFLIGGGLYAKDEIFYQIKKKALEKSHRELVNMSQISKSLTSR